MPYPVKAEVQAILKDYHPRIRSVVEQAWSELRTMAALRAASDLGPLMYSRTISNDMFDAIARYGLAEFDDDTSVSVKLETQTFKLFFKGSICARFKKGNGNKLGQNIPTQAVMAFKDADGTLPGFPPKTAKVEFIWIANDLNTRLEHVLVIARDGDKLIWDYEIEASGTAEGTGTVIPFPPTPPARLEDGDNLITPKIGDAKKKTDKE